VPLAEWTISRICESCRCKACVSWRPEDRKVRETRRGTKLGGPIPFMKRDWQSTHHSRITTATLAIAEVPRGRRILIGSGAAEPASLVHALVDSGDHLADNEIVHLLTLGPAPYVQPGLEHRFRHTAFFIGDNVREAVQAGRADFIPVFLSELPRLISTGKLRIDVVLIQVSPPDAHGYVSLGVSVDIVRAAVDSAKLVIAEVNPRMPRTLGDSFLHVSRIAKLVPVDTPIYEHPVEPLDDVSLAIGRHVATLIPDGATIQTGIGRIPHAVLEQLADRRDLGVHTEMLSDSIMELARKGAITGRKKTLLPGKIVTSFIMGSRELYDWVDDNPAIEMRGSEFTNDPMTIARNDDMVAINGALAVDLTGQVAADTLMGRFFSGNGGQVDIIRGSARSRGGRPIIALPSTARNGSISRICATLGDGAGIVTSRGDVHYVATEYGIADLWGKTVRERATALSAIAHPDFRGELLDAAKARHYVFADQRPNRAVYPVDTQSDVEVDGHHLVFRPVRASDEEALHDLFYSLSDESARNRFLGTKSSFPRADMRALADVDYERRFTLVVVDASAKSDDLIAVASYGLDPATGLAEVDFVVRDDWQGRGVGTVLMQRMIAIGKQRGLRGFTASVLSTNSKMLGVFYQSELKVVAVLSSGVCELTARFPEPPRPLAAT
jgi:acyl-CoA hydrolase/RimJ/RimL family protein N-acetyltransferase